MELLSQDQQEPTFRNIDTDCSHDARGSEEGTCNHTEPPQRSHLLSAKTVCSRQSVSPLTCQEIKAESDTDNDRSQQPTDSIPSSLALDSKCRAAQSDHSAAKSHRAQKTDEQMKVSLCSKGTQSTHVLHIKTTRPLPHSSHPSQSIQRWHNCKECGKGFSFACQLEVHMRWHTKEKPYSCAVCHKSFTTVSMLKRHHRIHTGEKPFHCHVCGKCFNQSAHLNTHLRLHTRERASWS